MASAGTVYLLQSGSTPRYKIGRTINSVSKRIRSGLATGNPDPLREVASWDLPIRHGDFESLLHCEFASRRLRGSEFFDFTDYPETLLLTNINELHAAFLQDLLPDYTPTTQLTDEYITVDDDTLNLLQRRILLTANIRRLEIELESLDLNLKSRVGSTAGLQTSDGRPLLTYKTSATTRVDTAALKENHPDLVAQYTKSVNTRYLRHI
jgi:hypothetical protein